MNVLWDPLFRVMTDQGMEPMSLPRLLEALGQETVRSLVGIQRHQAEAVHVFLCYLAGAVLARQGHPDPVQSAAAWRAGLQALAGPAGDAAWALAADAVDQVAFLQPPLPRSDQDRLKRKALSPDELDLLVTSKNHDIKIRRAVSAHPDEWIYALISLQTMSGYSGPFNYGISRMNSGIGNRLIVELVRSLDPGRRWRDAVARLLAYRPALLDADYGYDPHGLVLVWLEPWDGKQPLPLTQLDPFYLEVCRRVRLRLVDGAIAYAEGVPSLTVRIDAQARHGAVGDAWLPIDHSDTKKGPRALTASAQGLPAHFLRRLVFADQVQLTPLQQPGPDWTGPAWLQVSVLVRGQGVTEGFHERQVPLPGPGAAHGAPCSGLPAAGAAVSASALEWADTMQYKVLRPGLYTYLSGDGNPRNIRTAAQAWVSDAVREFDRRWTAAYFPWLETLDADETDGLDRWAACLRDHAQAVFEAALQRLPRRSGFPYRASAQAHGVFWGSLYRRFPMLKSQEVSDGLVSPDPHAGTSGELPGGNSSQPDPVQE